MTTITYLSPLGNTVAVVDANPGQSVMQAALAAGVEGIEAECGGSMTCATCHVYVSEAQAQRLPPASADETAMLDFVAAERRPTSRLSCQVVASGELAAITVQLPDRQV
jgi:ferredoxin, 2Fe-2S